MRKVSQPTAVLPQPGGPDNHSNGVPLRINVPPLYHHAELGQHERRGTDRPSGPTVVGEHIRPIVAPQPSGPPIS